jgi:hypothetical protein
MIIEAILNGLILAVGGVLQGLSAVLPDGAVPAIGALVHGYDFLNAFLPVAEVFEVAALSLGILVVIAGWYAVMFAIRQIPFLGIGR